MVAGEENVQPVRHVAAQLVKIVRPLRALIACIHHIAGVQQEARLLRQLVHEFLHGVQEGVVALGRLGLQVAVLHEGKGPRLRQGGEAVDFAAIVLAMVSAAYHVLIDGFRAQAGENGGVAPGLLPAAGQIVEDVFPLGGVPTALSLGPVPNLGVRHGGVSEPVQIDLGKSLAHLAENFPGSGVDHAVVQLQGQWGAGICGNRDGLAVYHGGSIVVILSGVLQG